jgi:hypothetical protein
MRVIVPVTPTLVSHTVAEPAAGETVWSGATTYPLDAEVISTSTHLKYTSLQAGNLNNPLPVSPETSTAWWIVSGVTNRQACLDLARNTQSTNALTMTVRVSPGQRVNSFALMGLEAEDATVNVYNGATLVYTRTYDLRLRRVRNGYDYCFKPFDLQASVVEFDVPPFTSSEVEVILTRASGDVKLGSFVVGNYAYLGRTQFKAVNDALNFSVIERDDFGTATLVPRRTLPKTMQTLEADKDIINDIIDVREDLNAVPAVWSGLDDQGDEAYFDALLVLGIYKQFSINLAYFDYAEVTLELEEI